jgi:hypothetical protein
MLMVLVTDETLFPTHFLSLFVTSQQDEPIPKAGNGTGHPEIGKRKVL